MDNSKNLENESFSLSESFKNLSLENKESFASLNSTGQTAPPFFSPHKNIWHKAADKSSKNSYIYKNKNFITKDTPIKYREPCIPTGKTPPRKVDVYTPYLTSSEILSGLKAKKYFTGILRINKNSFQEAYLSSPSFDKDLFVEGLKSRNRALNGDVVYFEVLPRDQWKILNRDFTASLKISGSYTPKVLSLDPSDYEDAFLRKTASVVGIYKKVHPRTTIGYFKEGKKRYMLYSTDKRVPRIFINHSSLWKELLDEQGHHLKKAYFNNYLFLVEIVFWNTDSLFPSGKVVKMLGRGCCIETETEALKLDYSVPSEVWDAGVTACLPCLPWTIPASEYQLREDLRKDCIFTVDPATARDLDDALSITETPDGCCIVGVHIADVSYFVTPDTPLDLEARHRACTVYLVQQSFCMLPRLLSEDVCSLLPGRDRLAVSLFWKLNAQAEVLAHWSRRSVVHSCCQLSYDDAQMIIDLKTDAPLRGRVTHGEHTLEQIAASIIKLNALAAHLQAQRIKNGSLHLDFPKLDFELDKLGHPVSVQRHETCAARCMVSEFMILANATVANILRDNFPDQAFLRAHSAPEDGRLCKVASFLENYNIHIDGTSSASLLSSLDCLQKRVGSDLDSAELDLVIYYLIKPMQTARYVCPEAEYYRELKARAYKVWATRDQEGPPHENWFDFFTDSWGDQHIQALVDYLAKHGVRCTSEPMTAELLRHYSLALPMYTHFTSPIRRYADIITHRMLLSATEGTDFGISTCELSKLAEHCNRRRLLVSDAQLQSNRVFLGAFIARRGPLRVNGIVASIYDKSFDVFIPAYGLESRVNICEIPHLLSSELKDGYLLFTWKSGSSGFILLESINLKRVSEILNKKFGFCDVSQDGPVQTIIPFTQLQLECSCDLSKPHMDINVIPVVQRQEHA